jgi:hypothetical protein
MPMHVKVTQNPKPLSIPYLRYGRPDSHSYVDLKRFPDQISVIPEVKGWPELEVTLVELNRPDSPFSTIGCEKQIQETERGYGMSGYVGVRFEDLETARSKEAHARLFDRFNRQVAANWPGDDTHVEFEMQRTASTDRPMEYWSFSIWLIVREHPAADEAKDRWSIALRAIREFLLESGTIGLLEC